jgi:hypothetical protein
MDDTDYLNLLKDQQTKDEESLVLLNEEKQDTETFTPWIGVDLDGTLAYYEKGYAQKEMIGDPIPEMFERVKGWIADGKKVKIFTARVYKKESVGLIKDWLKKVGLPELDVTNIKDPGMYVLYDDRAVQVQQNTGKLLGKPI